MMMVIQIFQNVLSLVKYRSFLLQEYCERSVGSSRDLFSLGEKRVAQGEQPLLP